MKQSKLYFLVLGLMLFVVLTALGGGIFGQQQPWMLQWQHQLFAGLCHQMPSRSFWISGQPMAVCSRCFGIYSGFLLGWILLPVLPRIVSFPIAPYKALIIMLGLNIFDIIGNVIGFWQNTLGSRWVLGGLMGLAAAVLFSGAFFRKTTTKKEEHYGRITTAGAGE